MATDEHTPDAAPEPPPPPAIRRGQGLRLSISTPPSEEPEPEAAPAPAPELKGQALRLSVSTPLNEEPELEPAAPAPVIDFEIATPTPPAAAPAIDFEIAAPTPPAAAPAMDFEIATPAPTAAPAPATTNPRPLADWDEMPREVTAATPRVRLKQGTIRYRQFGSGPPLLLVHGWGASSRIWLNTLRDMADARKSYALDLPGFGESPPLKQAPSLASMAAVLIAFADALGLEQFDLIGHSFGAGTAAYLAANYEGRVRRLVLTAFGLRPPTAVSAALGMAQGPLNLTLGLWQPLLNLWQPWATTFLTMPPVPQLAASWLLDAEPNNAADWRENVADMTRVDPRTHLACLTSATDPALIKSLEAIKVPTLFTVGRMDRVTTVSEVETAQHKLPHSHLVVLEGCGHMPMLEQPAIFNKEMRDFLLDEHLDYHRPL